MSEMVEKVARAMAWTDLCSSDSEDAKAAGLSAANIVPDEHMKSLARAAIEAMREPTKGMVEAIYDKGEDTFEYDNVGHDFITETWCAGINAALKEE